MVMPSQRSAATKVVIMRHWRPAVAGAEPVPRSLVMDELAAIRAVSSQPYLNWNIPVRSPIAGLFVGK